MRSFLAKLIARPEKFRLRRGKRPAAKRVRPALETLEARVVPSGSDWSMYNYDIAGTRDNTAEHTLSPSNVGDLHVLWNFPTAGPVAGTPAVVNGVVYAGDRTGMFYAVKSDGTLLWQTQLVGQVTASALVTQGTVVIGTNSIPGGNGDGFIYGLDAATGAVKWQIHPNTSAFAAVWGSATLVGKNVAIGIASDEEFVNTPPTSRGSLVLLNPKNGNVIWQTYTVTDAELADGVTGAGVWGAPTYDPTTNIIYVGTGNNYGSADKDNPTKTNGTSDAMIAFDAKDGHMIWVNQVTNGDNWNRQFTTGGPDYDIPDSPHIYTLADGEKVVGAGQKSGFYWVFDAQDGHIVNNDVAPSGKPGLQVSGGGTLGGLYASAAFDPSTGVVFANDRDTGTTPASGHLFAIAGDGSQVLWQVNTPTPAQSGVAVANGVVYFETTGGILYAVDEATGTVLAKIAANGNVSGPAISNGRLYMGQGNLLGGNPNGPNGIAAIGLSETQQGVYVQTNLVSDIPGEAKLTDPNLQNPWGVSFSATSPFWVSNQRTNTSTLYAVTSTNGLTINSVSIPSLVVNIPTTGSGPQGPTGQVQNNTTSFVVKGTTSPASFIFANLNGQISAWNGSAGTTAVVEATTAGAVYTGLAIGSNASGNFLYAANDAGSGSIDIFDGTFARVMPNTDGFGATPFVDPLLPPDLKLVPFNVQNIGGDLYVEYAPSGRMNQVNAEEGDGAVAIFDTSGNFIRQVVAGSKLAAPWGVALAPSTFGAFGGDLLVGNFAYEYSEINAFDPTTGAFVGTLADANGNPLFNQALWAIAFGRGGNNGDPNTLFFAAGIEAEMHGLFGAIQAAPTLAADAPIVPNLPNGVEQTFSTRSVFSTTTTGKEGGDQNPYGVAFVPADYTGGGALNPGDILVSNFNNSDNVQGTGSTIIRITPSGERSVFFQGQPGLGLTTALGVLKSGFVIVGSVPTTDGTFDTIQQGSLLILDSNGNLVETLSDSKLLDGPWDLAINDQGSTAQVFVSNVLSGTVTRINLTIPANGIPVVKSMTQIASGYKVEANEEAVVVGPTGLAYDAQRDILYVASTDDNAIFAIDDAGDTHKDHGKGKLIYKDDVHLHGPLGLVLLPNGDLITANGDAVNPDPMHPSELVEFTTKGKFVAQFQLDKDPDGPFGIAVSVVNGELRFAAVNDNTNTLETWTFQLVLEHHTHHHDGDHDTLSAGHRIIDISQHHKHHHDGDDDRD